MAKGKPADDAAGDETSLFFLLCLLLIVLLPWTYSVSMALLFPGRGELRASFPEETEAGGKVRYCQTEAMATKKSASMKRLQSRSRVLTRGFNIRTTILLALWVWVLYIARQIQVIMATHDMYHGFNPYDILDVSYTSSAIDAKKAFRKLSLMYHPDKNPSAEAKDKFILVKKAYDCLTDPVAKRNYQLYGNPDGPVRMEIGMAIPSVSKEHQGLVLALFTLLFVIGVPVTMLLWINAGGQERLPSGVYQETLDLVTGAVGGELSVKEAHDLVLKCPESEEARLWQHSADFEKLAKELPRLAKDKAALALFAHVLRKHGLLSPEFLDELQGGLVHWRAVALVMAMTAAKRRSQTAVASAVALHQCLVQALEPSSSPLRQVPHVEEAKWKNWKKDLPKFLRLTEERKRFLEASGLSAPQLLDVEEFVAVAPRLVVQEAKVFVIGEDTIEEGDLATLEVSLLRENLREGEAAGPAHCHHQFADEPVKEAWWLFAAIGRRTVCMRLEDADRVFKGEVRFQVPTSGKIRVRLELVCEAYAGLDVEHVMTFDAKRAGTTKSAPYEAGSDDD